VRAYYNEIDRYCCDWLQNLMDAGHITPGRIDDRSIADVSPDDVRGYERCHFFAGIAGWELALSLSGYTGPVWTGSCPCQPFSVANRAHGGAKGQSDERDAWPHFAKLISERCPPVVFGEQVPSAIGWGWWDRAAMGLEEKGYACAAMVLRADAYGAQHERRRLYWMAFTGSARWSRHKPGAGISCSKSKASAINGNPLAGARRALGGDYGNLLPFDGVSLAVERLATKAYGNAIVPQVAAEFIKASMTP